MKTMKTSLKEYIEIVLTISIIVALFLPYINDAVPIHYLFYDFIAIETVFFLTIPILVIIPFLIILIFKDVLKISILRLFKTFFLFVYLIVLGFYFYGMYESFNETFENGFYFIIAIVLSLLLVLLTFKFSTQKSEQLQHILLANLALPIILYFFVFVVDDNFYYGGYILNISFFLLYILALYSIYSNSKINKLGNK